VDVVLRAVAKLAGPQSPKRNRQARTNLDMERRMNPRKIILKELLERKKQFLTSFIAILLGIIVIVAVKSVSNSSEKAVAIQLDNLGANILVLPQATTIDNYYAADINAPEMPEDYVERIASSTIPGVDNMSPKLSARIKVKDYSLVLTGILPRNELASKPIWQTAGFADPELQAACDPSNIMNKSRDCEDPKLQRTIKIEFRRRCRARNQRDSAYGRKSAASDRNRG
jgi:hypothetical protein